MTDQPPPPSDKKPRRRSAPRKRAPAKRAPDAEAVSASDASVTSRTVTVQDAALSAPEAVAEKLDPHPLQDAGDRGDAPVDDAPLATEVAPSAAPAARRDRRERRDKVDRPSVEPSQADAPSAEPPSPPDSTAVATPPATAPFPRQAKLRPGELIRVPLSVRWRDLDAFNHVNNSKYLSYLEEARLRWMLAMPGMGMDEDVAPVVAASNLNYRRPIEWPGDVVIELFVERIGGSSLTIGHRIVDSKDGGTLYCDGNVVMVWIDRNSGRSAPLPDGVRAACR